MRLKLGQPAKPFSVSDLQGNSIKLEDFKGKKLMVSFYRYASCVFCNLRIHQLIQKHDELKARGLTMLAFFQSPKESILEYVGKQNAPFPIIPDPKREIYKLYGVESSMAKFAKGIAQFSKYRETRKLGFKSGKKEGNITSVPADFLIDEKGIIRTAYYGKDITDHVPISEIEEFLSGGPGRN